MSLEPRSLSYRFVNWGRTQRANPIHYYEPENEAEVVALVERAAEQGVRLKVVGAGHSWSAAACTDGYLLSLDRLDAVLDVDRERGQVTVEAGIRLEALNERLAEAGLGLSNLSSISEQSVAGAIATGTHGTGVTFGNLATQVVALRLITGLGERIDLTEESHGDVFFAARQSLGALGVVTRVTLQCEPAFRLEERAFALPFDEALVRLDALVAEHEHFKLYWFPFTGEAKVVTFNRTSAPLTRRGPLRRWVRKVVIDRLLFRLAETVSLWVGRLIPLVVPPLNRLAARVFFRRERFVERSDRVFNIPEPARHDETEYAVPVGRAAEALRALRERVLRDRLPVNFVVEARWVAADRNPMSATYRRAGCHIGAYAFGPRLTAVYFPMFWELMRRFDGRAHLGKTVDLDPIAARGMFPGYDRFDELRRQLDPLGLFANRFIRRLFG